MFDGREDCRELCEVIFHVNVDDNDRKWHSVDTNGSSCFRCVRINMGNIRRKTLNDSVDDCLYSSLKYCIEICAYPSDEEKQCELKICCQLKLQCYMYSKNEQNWKEVGFSDECPSLQTVLSPKLDECDQKYYWGRFDSFQIKRTSRGYQNHRMEICFHVDGRNGDIEEKQRSPSFVIQSKVPAGSKRSTYSTDRKKGEDSARHEIRRIMTRLTVDERRRLARRIYYQYGEPDPPQSSDQATVPDSPAFQFDWGDSPPSSAMRADSPVSDWAYDNQLQ